jgi:hypothetical protein
VLFRSLRPRLTDVELQKQINTGNKRETRIVKFTYTEPSNGTVPLINRVPVTYEGVNPETVPQASISGGSAIGSQLSSSINSGWTAISWQWYRNGEAIEGAANESYTISPADEKSDVSVKIVAQSATGVMNNAGDKLSVTEPIESKAITAGELISVILGEDGKTVTANIGNGATVAKTLDLIIAVYDKDGRLEEVKRHELKNLAPGTLSGEFIIALEKSAQGKSVKAYIWDDAMVPVIPAITLA